MNHRNWGELIDHLNDRDEARPDRKRHRLPTAAYAASGCAFFFTLCARHLGRPFADATLAGEVVASLRWRRSHHRWTLFCYCLMPDHLHFLLSLPDRDCRWINAGARGFVPEGVLEHVGRFKQYTTTQVWWPRGSGNLWQKSSYDSVVRDAGIPTAAAYILDNPVRKGIAARWEDYPYAAIVDPW